VKPEGSAAAGFPKAFHTDVYDETAVALLKARRVPTPSS
jgi:hypothetical protein